MAQAPNSGDSSSDPFGPAGAPPPKLDPRNERYNTRYIIASLKRDDRRGKLMALGLVLLVAAAIAGWIATRPAASEPKLPSLTSAPAQSEGSAASAKAPSR